MPQYLVTFSAYIDERKRPENFPHEVRFGAYVTADTHKELVEQANLILFQRAVQSQGIATALDISKMEQTGAIDFSNRIWVPMHMITHIIPEVRLITEVTPVLFEETGGPAQLPSGEKEKLQ